MKARFLRVVCIATASVCSLVNTACRTPDEAQQSSATDTSGGCDLPAITTGAMVGKDVFSVTSQCVFNRQIHDVRIRILSETFKKVLEDGCADRNSGYGHVIQFSLNGVSIDNVGIRVRGNTSKCNEKRQFKIKFDETEFYSVFQGQYTSKTFPENEDRRFFGVEVLNLRASANDPSFARERLATRIVAKVEDTKPTTVRGAPVYRTAFAKVYVSFNRRQSEGAEGSFRHLWRGYWFDYKGFYSLAENIDKVFLESRFQKDDEKLVGHLFKSDLGQAHFTDARFVERGFEPELFEGKKVKTADQTRAAYAAIRNFGKAIESARTEAELGTILDIDSATNYVTSILLTGHWDSLYANRNNDFLYFNDKTKKWHFLIWDLDNSLGVIYNQYQSFMRDDIFAAGARHQVEPFAKLHAPSFPQTKSLLKQRLRMMLTGYYGSDLDRDIDEMATTVLQATEPWEGVSRRHFDDIKNFVKARRDKIGPQIRSVP